MSLLTRLSASRRALERIAFVVGLVSILMIGYGRRAEWATQLNDYGVSGDALNYYTMAIHLEDEHMSSLDGKHPTWTRLPGYPWLLRTFTSPSPARTRDPDAHTQRALVWQWIRSAAALNWTTDLVTGLAVTLLALALGAGGWSLLATLVWAWQPWSSVIALHPLSDTLATALFTLAMAGAAALVSLEKKRARVSVAIAAGGVAGLAQYVRGDMILLLAPLVIAGFFAGRSRREKALFVALPLLAWTLVFGPWTIRNLVDFHSPHPLGGGVDIDKRGNPFDRTAVFAWLRTWAASEQATVKVAWRIPSQPLSFVDLPGDAWDSPEERAAVIAMCTRYNLQHANVDDDMRKELTRLADAHRERHPLAFWIGLPLRRMALVMLPPRDGYALGTLPTIKEHRSAWLWGDRAAFVRSRIGEVAQGL